MSHEIESMMSVREVPWHGLGKILNNPPTVEEAIVAAGLDWNVRLQPLHAKYDGEEISVPAYATVRDSDRHVLGVVGPTYQPLQNKDAFKFFQPFLDAKEAVLETAGSLRGGRRVWVLARVTQDPVEVVPGDDVLNYVLLSNGHDGTLAVRVGMVPVRVVCANTLAAAHNDGASKLLRVKHTKNSTDALGVVRETMDLLRREFLASTEQYRALARLGVSTEDVKAYVRKVFQPKVSILGESEQEAKCKRLLGKILPLLEEGRGNNMPGVRGTAWGMYNAVTDFLSHERGRDEDTRVDSLWFGNSAEINSRALRLAVAMA